MSELSPLARALVEDGQSVLRPSPQDRARVAKALATRLGAVALVAAKPAGAVAAAPLKGWLGLSNVVVGIGATVAVIGASYFAGQTPELAPAPVEPPRLAVAPREEPQAMVTTSVAPAPAPEVVPTAEPAVSPPRKVAPADLLAEELAILSKATSALRAGKPAEGLKLLDEHQRRFPSGRLTEERRAARVQALCALGKLAAAEAELARLAQSSPRSPHLARAERACGVTH